MSVFDVIKKIRN